MTQKNYKLKYSMYGSPLKDLGEFATFNDAITEALNTYKTIGSSSNYVIESPNGKITKLIADEKGIRIDV